jgi:dihydrofolate reductase
MKAVFGVNKVGGFGVDGGMPWPTSGVDLARFKHITSGGTVVMGKGTWLSNMPKPLPNRRNIVLSKELVDSRCEVYSSINDLLLNTEITEEVFVIGGAKVLWTLRPYINKVYLSVFNTSDPADVTFDAARYLLGFTKNHQEILDDHRFEIWDLVL